MCNSPGCSFLYPEAFAAFWLRVPVRRLEPAPVGGVIEPSPQMDSMKSDSLLCGRSLLAPRPDSGLCLVPASKAQGAIAHQPGQSLLFSCLACVAAGAGSWCSEKQYCKTQPGPGKGKHSRASWLREAGSCQPWVSPVHATECRDVVSGECRSSRHCSPRSRGQRWRLCVD